jgi:hypothetical protein
VYLLALLVSVGGVRRPSVRIRGRRHEAGHVLGVLVGDEPAAFTRHRAYFAVAVGVVAAADEIGECKQSSRRVRVWAMCQVERQSAGICGQTLQVDRADLDVLRV